MGNLKFGDLSTKDLDLVIQTPPAYTFPEKDVKLQHIPGRNGDIILDNNCYKNVQRTYSIASVIRPGTNFVSAAERIAEWLTANTGYQRLEDSYEPEVYRLAMFKDSGSMTNYCDAATAINVTFECKPQRYLKIGEKPVEFSAPYTDGPVANLYNPTLMPSLPEITLSNLSLDSEHVLMIDLRNYKDEVSSIMTLSNGPYTNITIDSEKQQVYTINDGEITNASQYINLNALSFPKLDRQNTEIKIDKYLEEKSSVTKYNDLIDNEKKTIFALYKPYDTLVDEAKEKGEAKSFSSLIETKQESYNMEAYGNLCLDQSMAISFKSFNDFLQNNCCQIRINSNNYARPMAKIVLRSPGYEYYWSSERTPSQKAEPVENVSGVSTSDKEYYSLFISKMTLDSDNEGNPLVKYSGSQFYILSNNDITDTGVDDPQNNNERIHGAFVSVTDLTDDTFSTKTIKYVQAIPLPADDDAAAAQNYYRGGGPHSQYNLFNVFPELKGIIGQNHDLVITLYPATIVDGQAVLNLQYESDTEQDPIAIRSEIAYSDETATGRQLLAVKYVVNTAGYYYKAGNSGVLGVVSSLFGKLFNATGWTKIDEVGKILESVEWNEQKKAFVYGSLLSESSDYVIERNFIPLNSLPQYEDLILEDTYVKDEKGNTVKDSAGNPINEIIKCRFEIQSVDDKVSKIEQMIAKYDGFYKIYNSKNEPISQANQEWRSCTQGLPIILPSSGLKTNAVYKFIYIDKAPDYRDESDFPEWLDPIPILYDSDYNILDENLASELDKLNASYYDLKVSKSAYYRYAYFENNIQYNTEWKFLSEGYPLGQIDPAPLDYKRPVNEMLTINKIEGTADKFPIHVFEYIDNTMIEGALFIVLNSEATIYSTSKVYKKGDLILKPSNNQIVQACNIDMQLAEETYNPDHWDDLGLDVKAEEYDEDHNYQADDYCIYKRSLYKCVSDTSGEFDPNIWGDPLGNYIKDIGFYYLDDAGNQIEYPGNKPDNWLFIQVEKGLSDDFSDTLIKFYPNLGGLYKWDTNLEWVRKEISTEEAVIESGVKTDTYLYYLSESPLPQYEESNLYDFDIIQNASSGNPETVVITAKVSGFYKVGNVPNYIYREEGTILDKITIYETLDLIHLEKDNDVSIDNITITVVPRWWKL